MLRRNSPIIADERASMGGGASGLSALMTSPDKTAVASGDWSAPATWGGTAPVAGENVLIPTGIDVTYDLNSADALGWVRIDGVLRWSKTATTLMVVHTILGTKTSYLEMGDPVTPLTGSATVRFRDTALLVGDMMEMSLGLISTGRVMMRGKVLGAPFARSTGAISAGSSTVVTMTDAANVAGWEVGDEVYIPPTDGRDDTGASTTKTTITAISGANVTLATTLAHPARAAVTNAATGRVASRAGYVANMTRSITFESENPSGTRGHVMLAHGRHPSNRLCPRTDSQGEHRKYPDRAALAKNADPGVDVRWVAFNDLGRTQALASPQVGQPGNLAGRYAFHLHRVGHWSMDPVQVQGCVVNGARIWGFVQHDTHANFDWCIATRAQGSGMICEDDTEFGDWTRNFIFDIQSGSGDGEDVFNGHGRLGEAYTPNRHIRMRSNIAASCSFGIHLYLNEVDPSVRVADISQTPSSPRFAAMGRNPDIQGLIRSTGLPVPVAFPKNEDPNLGTWRGMQIYSCENGMEVFHRLRNYRAQTMYARLLEWDFWECGTCIVLQNYTWNYVYRDFTATDCNTFFEVNDKVSGIVFVAGHLEDIGTRINCNASARNAMGGFIDVTEVNVTTALDAPVSNTTMDDTIYSSVGWTVPNWQDPTTLGGDYHDTASASGQFPKYIVAQGGDSDPFGQIAMGAWAQGTAGINEGIPVVGSGYNQRPQSTDHSLTVVEMVEQYGCYNSGGDKVALDFPMVDRFTADVHVVRFEYDVSAAPIAVRDDHRLAGAPALATFDGMEASFPVVDVPASYLAFQEATYGGVFIAEGVSLAYFGDHLHTDLTVGQSRTVVANVTVEDGASQTDTAQMTFDVQGRGAAPANVSAPTITRHGIEITGNMTAPTNTSSGSDRYSLRFDLGEWTGFPEGTFTVRILINGAEYTAYDFKDAMYWAMRTNQLESIQIGVTASNEHGTSAEVLSNVVQAA